MKYLFLILLAAALLWIAYIAWVNRRKSPYGDGSTSDATGGDSGDGFMPSGCGSSDGGCGGDGGGGD